MIPTQHIQCELPEKGSGPLFCERHDCKKSRHMVALCHAGQRGESPGVKFWLAWEEGRGPGQHKSDPSQPPGRKYLGDRIHDALSAVGITEERVGKWLGRPCKCPERRKRVNQIHRWVERKVRGLFGSKEEARKDLEDILDQ